MNARIETSELNLRALSRLLTGGLFVEEDNNGITPEQAALHIAGVQAKALLLALGQTDGGTDEGWGHDHKWTNRDSIAMAVWLTTFLQDASVVIAKLRERGELRDSVSPSETEGGAS
ncbi:MAG: hypothetical protein QM756_10520 [Polyangiaceae bacterium]